MHYSKVLCLLGPTASGKTDLALQLAEHLPCDFISVDATMIYRGLDIGSAKPDAATLRRYPHALINICEPTARYSAAQFRNDALACIQESVARQRVPVLVGGTMLYHRVLQQGIAELPASDPTVRTALQQQAAQQGWVALHQELQLLDPVAAQRIHPNDPQRVLRALEVYKISGKTLSAHWEHSVISTLPYTFVNIGLRVAREVVRARIATRFYTMLAQGLVNEVDSFFTQGRPFTDFPAMQAVGYRHVWQYLAGALTAAQMTEQAIDATRQLAKRQMTWLRRWPNLHWIEASEDSAPTAIHNDAVQRVVDFFHSFSAEKA